MDLYDRLLGSFSLSLAASAVASPFILKLLSSIKSRQEISQYVPEHAKKQGTPTMGGLIVLVGLLLSGFVFGGADAWPLMTLVLLFALIGFVDDFVVPRCSPGKRGLGWVPKLLMQFSAAALSVGWHWSQSPGLSLAVCAGMVFWVVAVANAYNFADGLDGLAGTIGLILAVTVAMLGLGGGLQLLAVAMIGLAGAIVPFLFINAPPAKVFMGDVGSLPIGAALAFGLATFGFRGAIGQLPGQTAELLTPGYQNPMVFILVLFLLHLVLLAELIPVPLQIISVKLFKKRIFPKTPIHHAFEVAGWPETKIVALFGLAQLVACILAFLILKIWLGGP